MNQASQHDIKRTQQFEVQPNLRIPYMYFRTSRSMMYSGKQRRNIKPYTNLLRRANF